MMTLRIAVAVVALLTSLSSGVSIVHGSTDEGVDRADPSSSIPLSWDSFEINKDVFPLPLARKQLYPLLEDMKGTVSGMQNTVKANMYPQEQYRAVCPLVVSMTAMYQTPLSMEYAYKEKIIALEKKKKEEAIKKQKKTPTVQYAIAALDQKEEKLPASSDPAVKVMYVAATAYSSTVDQTDASPCITANGFNVCKNNKENVVAANFLPFGTKIRIPEMYGDRVFTVHDRMAKRFSNRVDVWMKTREAAMQFGVRKIKIEVLEN